MNMGKIFSSKILVNWIQQHNKKIIPRDQVGFIPGMQGWFSIYKPTNMIEYMHRIKDKNYMVQRSIL